MASSVGINEHCPLMTRERSALLVTGGSSRIGRAICLHLAQLGYRVIVHSRANGSSARKTAADCTALGLTPASSLVEPLHRMADASSLIERAAVMASACDTSLDGVVANASMYEFDTIAIADEEVLQAHATANFFQPLAMLQAFLKIRAATRGTVPGWFTFISDQKLWNPNPDYFSYSISKGLVPGCLDQLAVSVAPHLRVNVVVSGLTLPSSRQTPEQFQSVHDRTALGVGGSAQDIAEACAYLASAKATTATTLFTDAGQRFVRSERDVMFEKA